MVPRLTAIATPFYSISPSSLAQFITLTIHSSARLDIDYQYSGVMLEAITQEIDPIQDLWTLPKVIKK